MNKQKLVLENTFKKTFDMARFVEFTTEFFNGVQIVAPNKMKDDRWNWSEFSVYIDGYFHVANYVDPEKNKIAIFAVKLKKDKSLEKARSMQRNFVAKLLSVGNMNGAIVAFYSNEDTKWRLSFVKLEMEYLKGKVGKKITPAKRYSYLVGDKEPCHTAMNRLLPIFENEQFNPTLAQIEEAFSVEVVTKVFFEQYKQKYIELKEYLEQNECFIRQGEKHGFTAEQFAKKLMGQLAFLYFLQKKGWMGVKAIKETLTEKQYKDAFFWNAITRSVVPKVYKKVADDKYQRQTAPLNALNENEEFALASGVANCADAWGTGSRTYMRDIFDYSTKIKINYFDDVLEPMFYNALNKKRDANDYYCKLHCRIPFLNGGLFEPFGDDWGNNDFDIPNEMFSEMPAKDFENANGILDIFDRYNFTINEDEPLEREVAVDPEMLGKIFENLLDVKDRKSKGAFYTPREIVHYMCQESLINYLVNEVGAPYEDIKQFILYGEILKDEDTSWESKKGVSVRQLPESVYAKLHEIDKALENVKVADPAVGSGAFPMGMVSEICKARNNITSYMSLELSNSYDKRILFTETRNPYWIKKETLRNCIFAVDIEPSAVDITKLRLWLSLVVEQDIDAQNKNPNPLPNLDFNIMCGNSLIDEFEGSKLFDENILTGEASTNIVDRLMRDESDKMFNKMFDAQRDLFFADDHFKKEELKNSIKNYIDIMVGMQLQYAPQSVRDNYEIAKNKASTPFFLWKLQFAKVFKEKGGFDIVIGNPPYVKIQHIDNNIAKMYKKNFACANGKFDIYILFIEKFKSLINENGIVSYIQPHRFLTADYGKDIRNIIHNDGFLKKFIHFGVNQIFDSATTYTGIFFFTMGNKQIEYVEVNDTNFSFVEFESKKYSDLKNEWVFKGQDNSKVMDKINSQKAKVLDIFEGIYQGVISLGDDIFVMSGKIEKNIFFGYSKALGKEVQIESSIVRPLLKGENIRRYLQPISDIFIIYPHQIVSGKTKPFTEDLIREKYPLFYTYISNFKEYLIEKKIKYKTNSEYWYSLHRARELSLFDSAKVLTPQLQNYPNFTLDVERFIPDAGGYILKAKSEYEKTYLAYVGILNSELFWYFIKSTSTPFSSNYYYFKTAYIEPFRFPIISNEMQISISQIVNLIMENKKNGLDTSSDEKKVDKLVYELYGLTEEEIAIVEGKNE